MIEDVLLVDNKAATLVLVQVSGSWRTRHLRVRACALKQRVDLGKQKVGHVPGRSMLADLSTKSHPQARLTALRKMWSIETMYPDEVVESPTEKGEEETPKIRVKMIRARKEGKGKDELEEIGYKIGSRANACVRKLDQDLAQLEEEEKVLNDDYEKVKNTSEGMMTVEQSLKTAEEFEEVLMKQLRLEQKRTSVYERAYTEELLLRMRSVDYLRKHERIKFGSVKDIVDTEEYDIDPFMTIPKTPQDLLDKDQTKDELPWYWRDEHDNKVPAQKIMINCKVKRESHKN